jgi:hypothetical protein
MIEPPAFARTMTFAAACADIRSYQRVEGLIVHLEDRLKSVRTGVVD